LCYPHATPSDKHPHAFVCTPGTATMTVRRSTLHHDPKPPAVSPFHEHKGSTGSSHQVTVEAAVGDCHIAHVLPQQTGAPMSANLALPHPLVWISNPQHYHQPQ
jgi:hypothetical protein